MNWSILQFSVKLKIQIYLWTINNSVVPPQTNSFKLGTLLTTYVHSCVFSGPKTPVTNGPQFGTGTLKKNVHSGSSDEDPYSLTPSGSSGSSGKGLRDR